MYCEGARRRLQQQEGEQCGRSGSTGYFYGDCSSGLQCVPPADGAAPGTPSICHETPAPTAAPTSAPTSDKIFCTAPVQSTQYNDCDWLVTSGDDCMNMDANAQWCREHNRDRCPRQCPQ